MSPGGNRIGRQKRLSKAAFTALDFFGFSRFFLKIHPLYQSSAQRLSRAPQRSEFLEKNSFSLFILLDSKRLKSSWRLPLDS